MGGRSHSRSSSSLQRDLQELWEVGPQLPDSEWNFEAGGNEFAVEEKKGELMEFLDGAVEESGEKSVLLIR